MIFKCFCGQEGAIDNARRSLGCRTCGRDYIKRGEHWYENVVRPVKPKKQIIYVHDDHALCGATIGALAGGPVGALAGFLIGGLL